MAPPAGTVHCLTEAGEELYTFNTSLEAPAFISSTQYGRVVVSDWKNHIVRVYSKQGKVSERSQGKVSERSQGKVSERSFQTGQGQ